MSHPGPDAEPMTLERLVTRVGVVLGRLHQQVTADHGLTSTSVGALDVLARTDAVSHRELAARLGITPATLTPVVDALAEAGELTRMRDTRDRRVVLLSITERGRERLAVAAAAVDAAFRRLPTPSPQHETVIRDHLLAVLAAADAG